MKKLDVQIIDYDNLVALEFADSIKSLFRKFRDVRLFKELKVRATNIFENTTKLNLEGYLEDNVNRKVIDWLTKTGYPNLKGITVYVPDYMNCKYSELLDVMEANYETIKTIPDSLIVPSTNLFNMLLNDPELLRTRSKVTHQMVDCPLLSTDIDKLMVPYQKCFDVNSMSSEMSFTRAFSQIAEFPAAVKRTSAIQDDMARQGIDNVRAKSDALFDAAMALSHEFKNNPHYAEISAKVTEQLSEHLYACARWIEMYGLYVQQLTVIAAALRDTKQKINDMR